MAYTPKKEGTKSRAFVSEIDMSTLSENQLNTMARSAGAERQLWNWLVAGWLIWYPKVQAHVDDLIAQSLGFAAAETLTEESLPARQEAINGFKDKVNASLKKSKLRKTREEFYQAAYVIHGDTYASSGNMQKAFMIERANPESLLHWWVSEAKANAETGLPAHQVASSVYTQTFRRFMDALIRFSQGSGAPKYHKKGTDGGFTLIFDVRKATPWSILDGFVNPPIHLASKEKGFSEKSAEEQKAILELEAEQAQTLKAEKAVRKEKAEHKGKRTTGGNRIRLPMLGSVRLVRDTELLRRMFKHGNGVPKSARVTHHGDKWSVSITVSVLETSPMVVNPALRDNNRKQREGGAVGLDLGVAYLATLSDGTHFENPRLTRENEKKVARLQRKLDRQHRAGSPDCFDENGQHRSRNQGCLWGKEGFPVSRQAQATKRQLTRLHRLIALQREGSLHQISKYVTTHYDHVVMEDLGTKRMMKRAKPKPDPEKPGEYLPNGGAAKSGLNKSIADSAWGKLKDQIQYKADKNGIKTTLVNPKNTSIMCYDCGHKAKANRKTQAAFLCVKCGHTNNADINAAQNILEKHLKEKTYTSEITE